MARDMVSEAPTPGVAGSKTWGVRHWAMVILILSAFALRVYNLGGTEFWFDEALSANVSGLGWEGTISHLRSSPFEHPPLYFLSLYPWQMLAGTSEFAFRLYSVFWGVLLLPLLYTLVRRLAGGTLALLVALLATLSPFMVAYSQEARMYTLLPCLALAAMVVFWKALDQEDRPAWWLLYLAVLAIGVTTHYFFALLWVVTTLYLLIEALRYRKVRTWAIAAHVLILLAAVVWLVATPGLRDSLVRVGQGETTFSLAYKLGKLMPPLMVSEVTGGEVPPLAVLLAAGGWFLVLLGAWWSRRARALDGRVWLLLGLWLVVPLVGALLIPYAVLGRHLGYVLIPALIFMALGLLALARRGTPALGAGILVVLSLLSYGLVSHYTSGNGDFGKALAHVDARAQIGDLVVLTQPAQYPLVIYYNKGGWPVEYVPPLTDPPTPKEVDEALDSISQDHDRVWLGPIGAWTADPDLLVEQWLAANAFQAEKVWFPDSSSVTLYLTDAGEMAAAGNGRYTWGGRIRLRSLSTGPLQVAAGDALPLRFQWRPGFDLGERYKVSLLLVGDEGQVWAERHGEPCGGWCPTDEWRAGEVQADQHALLIPPGTPPGTYHLQVTWSPAGGGPLLQAEENGRRVEQITVAEVTVLRPDRQAEPWDLPNPLQVTFGGEVTLAGYRPVEIQARPGESVLLDTYWQADFAPTADYGLVVELVDERGEIAADWPAAPPVAWYPTGLWQAGEYVRAQRLLELPGSLPAGRYGLRIALLAPGGERLEANGQALSPAHLRDGRLELGLLEILDRPRRFEQPPVSHALAVRVGRQANLMGYDLDQDRAHPGGQLYLTLYWLAGGPMVQPYKVFTHLLDAEGQVLAQHDGQPGEGCCPANTWAEGEVIVDEHLLSLPADLVPGAYRLVVGMYDEQTDTRLQAYDGEGNPLDHNSVQIEQVSVEVAADGQGTVEPLFDFGHVYYLPLMSRIANTSPPANGGAYPWPAEGD